MSDNRPMTTDQLRDRALAQLPGGRAKFGVILMLILGAILTEVIAYFTEKALDKCSHESIRSPGWFARWQLRRRITRACSAPRVVAETAGSSWTPASLDAAHGDDVQTALLAMVAGLSDDEIRAAIR